jgi:hypothetical protein
MGWLPSFLTRSSRFRMYSVSLGGRILESLVVMFRTSRKFGQRQDQLNPNKRRISKDPRGVSSWQRANSTEDQFCKGSLF